jgi:hypothetical protein
MGKLAGGSQKPPPFIFARLKFPAIPAQYLVAELFVQLGIKSQARTFWSDAIHGAFRANRSRKIISFRMEDVLIAMSWAIVRNVVP